MITVEEIGGHGSAYANNRRADPPGIELLRMPAPPTQDPEEAPRLDRVPQGFDRPDPMPHHENN